MSLEIRQVERAAFNDKPLVELLRDAVDSGASVGFLAPLTTAVAADYWQGVRDELDAGRVLFCAYRDARLVGTVQLAPAGKPNARHRAEVQKLLVLQAYRGQGIGSELMRSIEAKALQLGRSLLPHVGDILSAAKPAFTKRKPELAANQPDLVQQQIAELQAAVSQQSAHIKELAAQLENTVTALETAAQVAEARLRRVLVFTAVAAAFSLAALGVAFLAAISR